VNNMGLPYFIVIQIDKQQNVGKVAGKGSGNLKTGIE